MNDHAEEDVFVDEVSDDELEAAADGRVRRAFTAYVRWIPPPYCGY
jgi:hypothetical protein